MTEEITNLKKLLAEREELISKLRFEIQEKSTIIIDYKVQHWWRMLITRNLSLRL